ncbi:MAG: EAL domain-containing protein [Marinobacter sp.]|uniref:sensor domain-containing protein n=1 Tax=Marinobacter sp. TaxID=50741 RepID=UPI00349FDA2C
MSPEYRRTAALRSSRQPDFELFDLSPNAYLLLTPDLTIFDANAAYLHATGRDREDLIGLPFFEAFPGQPGEPNFETLCASFERVLTAEVPNTLALIRYPVSRTTAAGNDTEDRYWSATHVPVFDEQGKVALILQQTVDVTELQQLKQAAGATDLPAGRVLPTVQIEESIFRRAQRIQEANRTLTAERSHLRRLFEQAPGFVCVLRGPEHVFELANTAYFHLVGRDTVGKSAREALPELAGQVFFDLLDRVYTTGEAVVGRAERIVLQRQPDEPPDEVYIDFVYRPITEADGSVSGIFVQGHDVSESHRLARELGHQAAHDHLTGLINRREFERRLAEAVEDSEQTRTHHCLLYLDLDHFKVVNDTCGHAAGDELLRRVSDLLRKCLHPGALLARLGGDEFGILLTDCAAEIAERVAEEQREIIEETEFSWGQRRFGLSVSIGVVSFDGAGFSLQEILSTADSACYLAKENGRNRVHRHHPADTELSARHRQMDWIGRLRDALQEERLVLYTQKIRALGNRDQNIDRSEILVRLIDVDGSLVPPMAFIPAAERYNLMPLIDRYVVRATLKHLSGLPAGQRERTVYGINLSGTTVSDESLVTFLQTEVAEYGISPHQICFEITETTAITNLTSTSRMMQELRASGFKFALDDFGSGMASYGYLKALPVDFVKIDGRFVKDILNDPVDAAMVDAIAKIARLMGIQTVAEYVENDSVIELLAAIGVDYAQGYGIHRPEPL